jgi:hypothetical protein
MSTPAVFVICDNNCKYEGMTKEQIYAAIVQAVNEGTIGEIDTGFITTIKTVNGTPLRFFVGTQAEYDTLTDKIKQNLFAIITNDTNKEGLLSAISALQTNFSEFEKGIKKGTVIVMSASQLNNNGTFFARKSIWKGSQNIAKESYVDLITTEDACNKYLVIETGEVRTYPMMFDTTKYTSISKTFEDIEIYVSNENSKRVRVYNRSQRNILVTNIYVEL